jgi:hypothetical protein
MREHRTVQKNNQSESLNERSTAEIMRILDLHKHTKEKAIQEMTYFFNQIRKKCCQNEKVFMVTLITGSGSHSQQGPVLRQAVQKTLIKRQMDFSINRGKGSFSVNALSGIDLFADDRVKQYSKVVFMPRNSNDNDVQLTGRLKPAPISSTRPRFQLGPLPSQVAEDDKLLEEVKLTSSTLTSRENAYRIKSQQNEMKNVMARSFQTFQEDKEKTTKEYEEQVAKAIDLSMKVKEFEKREKERNMEEALTVSMLTYNLYEKNYSNETNLTSENYDTEQITVAKEVSLKIPPDKNNEEREMEEAIKESLASQAWCMADDQDIERAMRESVLFNLDYSGRLNESCSSFDGDIT